MPRELIISKPLLYTILCIVVFCLLFLIYRAIWPATKEDGVEEPFFAAGCDKTRDLPVMKKISGMVGKYCGGGAKLCTDAAKSKSSNETYRCFRDRATYLVSETRNYPEFWRFIDKISTQGLFASGYTSDQERFEALQIISPIFAQYFIAIAAGSSPTAAVQTKFKGWVTKVYNIYIAQFNEYMTDNNMRGFYGGASLAALYILGANHNTCESKTNRGVCKGKDKGLRSKSVAEAAKQIASNAILNHLMDKGPNNPKGGIDGQGFVKSEMGRQDGSSNSSLSYTNYYIKGMFGTLIVIKETKVPFAWASVKEPIRKVCQLLSNTDVAMGRFATKLRTTQGKIKRNNPHSDMMMAMWSYLFEGGEAPNMPIQPFRCSAAELANALRTINKPMGTFTPGVGSPGAAPSAGSFVSDTATETIGANSGATSETSAPEMNSGVVSGGSMNPDTEFANGNVVAYRLCGSDPKKRGNVAAYAPGQTYKRHVDYATPGTVKPGYMRIPAGRSVTFYQTNAMSPAASKKVDGPAEFCLGGGANLTKYAFPDGTPVIHNFKMMGVGNAQGGAPETTTT